MCRSSISPWARRAAARTLARCRAHYECGRSLPADERDRRDHSRCRGRAARGDRCRQINSRARLGRAVAGRSHSQATSDAAFSDAVDLLSHAMVADVPADNECGGFGMAGGNCGGEGGGAVAGGAREVSGASRSGGREGPSASRVSGAGGQNYRKSDSHRLRLMVLGARNPA